MLKLDNQGLSGGLHELSFPQLDAGKLHTSLELKMCEYCPRSFMRTQGSSCKYCEACARKNDRSEEAEMKPHPVRDDSVSGARLVAIFDWRRAVERASTGHRTR